MTKPTHASVTEEPCACHYLEHQATLPRSPVVFDPVMNEYQIEYIDPEGNRESSAHLRIYHCPFCGGAAPPSKRGEWFAIVTPEESLRICQLFEGIKSLDEAIAKFGPPAHHCASGLIERPKVPNGQLGAPQVFRTITYDNLSPTAEVTLGQSATNETRLNIGGKYLGPPNSRQQK